MKKVFLSLIGAISAITLQANESMLLLNATNEMKKLIEAEERFDNGKTTFDDKVLFKIYLEPKLKEMQEETVFDIHLTINDPSYIFIANGALMDPFTTSTALDVYAAKKCVFDFSKLTTDEMKAIVNSKEFESSILLKNKTSFFNNQASATTKTDYKRFIYALRFANCPSEETLNWYLNAK